MKDHEIAEFVGIGYRDDGELPEDGFNCWGLLRYIQSRYYNRHLPAAAIGNADACLLMHASALHTGVYSQVSTPEDGDCVLLRAGTNPHVGVYLSNDGGGVLHSVAGMGVIWTPIHDLNRFGYARRIFYRVRENDRKTNSTDGPVSTDDQPN